MGGDVPERCGERQEQVWEESRFMVDRIWMSYGGKILITCYGVP